MPIGIKKQIRTEGGFRRMGPSAPRPKRRKGEKFIEHMNATIRADVDFWPIVQPILENWVKSRM